MCRYQDWEDDLPEREVHDEHPEEHRHVVSTLIGELEERMDEMSGLLQSMKEINARSKVPNKFLSGFFLGICLTLVLNYVSKYLTGKN